MRVCREAQAAHANVYSCGVRLMHDDFSVGGCDTLAPNILPPPNQTPIVAAKTPQVLRGSPAHTTSAAVPSLPLTPSITRTSLSGVGEEDVDRPSPAMLEILHLRQEQETADLKAEQEREARLAERGFKGFSPRLLSPRDEHDSKEDSRHEGDIAI
jgi:hypothetical protein